MTKRLDLMLEVAGCPTICKHCWAQGVPYNAMPLDDIRWVLEQTRALCAEAGMAFGSFPMHEVAAHPDAPAVLQLYRDILGEDAGFEPLATTGVPIVMREGWEHLITAIGATGTKSGMATSSAMASAAHLNRRFRLARARARSSSLGLMSRQL